MTFSAASVKISAEKNGDETLLFGDVLVENVLLCDLNDDGKREIIAEIKKNADGYNCAGIRVYDYANDVCHEFWADYMHYDLSSYGGTLKVNVWTKDHTEHISEFELNKLDEYTNVTTNKPTAR